MLENPRSSAFSKILLLGQFNLKSQFFSHFWCLFWISGCGFTSSKCLNVPSGWLIYYLNLQAINQVYIMKWLASVPVKFTYWIFIGSTFKVLCQSPAAIGRESRFSLHRLKIHRRKHTQNVFLIKFCYTGKRWITQRSFGLKSNCWSMKIVLAGIWK